MSRMKVGVTRAAVSFKPSTAVLLAGILVPLAQPVGHAQAPPLQFFKNYFLPGAGHVVAGIGLRGQGVNGFATGNVVISGVPADADIAAVFYYWMNLEPNGNTPMAEGALSADNRFRGRKLDPGFGCPDAGDREAEAPLARRRKRACIAPISSRIFPSRQKKRRSENFSSTVHTR